MPDIVAIGECMVEFFAEEGLATAPAFIRAFGGDTLNVAAAAARLGSHAGFVTRAADDPFGEYLLQGWRGLGIDVSRVRKVNGFNGIYFISILPGGQREFTYYRKGSAASTLEPADLDLPYLASARVVHASGITQAISASCRAAVREAFCGVKTAGGRALVSFDPNLRTQLWPVAEARAGLDAVLPFVDILLPSAPEETEQLVGIADPEAVVRHFWGRGVKTVVVKNGPGGCVVGAEGRIASLPAYPVNAVDTTGTGDAFNGAFLHGVVQGMGPVEAARLGNITAALKARGRGAVRSLPARDEVYRIFESG